MSAGPFLKSALILAEILSFLSDPFKTLHTGSQGPPSPEFIPDFQATRVFRVHVFPILLPSIPAYFQEAILAGVERVQPEHILSSAWATLPPCTAADRLELVKSTAEQLVAVRSESSWHK